MFSHLRQDIAARGQRLHEELVRTRSQLRQVRDEYHLAKAERPRYVSRLDDLVTRYNGLTLYRDRIERGREVRSLAGVQASVSESRTDAKNPSDGGAVRDVFLTITGPDWEWTIKTVAVISSRRTRSFAALVNAHSMPIPAPRQSSGSTATATSTGQFRVLDDLRGRGVLTDEEFSTAVSRLRGTPRS
jgi:hypothetical protein